MNNQLKYLNLSDLNTTQIRQYQAANQTAFPAITSASKVMKNNWDKLEKYFPSTQIFLIDQEENVIGFMSTVPIFWDQPLKHLPEEGWDWLLKKSIEDYQNNIKPNTLGGLQIIVTKPYQGKGFSKSLIQGAKKMVAKMGFENFIIPIRPTLKHLHPVMDMEEYMLLKKDHKVYDPWIRTHLNSGAKIIKVCKKSMHVYGDLSFWEKIIKQPISQSGSYQVDGALSLVVIDIEKNHGEYQEPNIWISYE